VRERLKNARLVDTKWGLKVVFEAFDFERQGGPQAMMETHETAMVRAREKVQIDAERSAAAAAVTRSS
jgi:hypothetical protein